MAWKLMGSMDVLCSSDDFISGVNVWLTRPGVINRKLMGAVILLQCQLPQEWSMDYKCILDHKSVTVGQLLKMKTTDVSLSDGCDRSECLVRELIPRVKYTPSCHECVIIDKKNKCVSIFQLKLPCKEDLDVLGAILVKESSYQFMFMDSRSNRDDDDDDDMKPCKICLYYIYGDRGAVNGVTVPTVEWLGKTLLPKILQWSNETSKGVWQQGDRRRGKSLIPLDKYSCLYQEMKDKYAPPLIKNWPERSDPLKYVYEDIAIASYLLVLWEEERKQFGMEDRQSFVDLGCGNGLLVYLLTSEGHPGRGLDIRERGIWKMYGQKANLQVCVLTPSSRTIFPCVDWLLGNHSDELTPWIPVMASRSSYSTRFFVLPCCTYDFNKKFCRQGSGESQYQSYLKYVRDIGEKMGFKVQEDTLRIPSSKKICLIGQERTYLADNEHVMDSLRQQFIDDRCGGKGSGQEKGGGCGQERDCDGGDEWVTGFNPRGSCEPVRNCSQIVPSISQFIVKTIASHLLHGVRASAGSSTIITTTSTSTACNEDTNNGATLTTTQHCHSKWNTGGRIHLSEAAEMFDKDVLRQLKKECGGLQTLLRNEHQVFNVHGGYIHLRDWSIDQVSPASTKMCGLPPHQQNRHLLLKTKLCWFHDNHPQGCPRSSSTCTYAHGMSELRPRSDFKLNT